MIDFKTIAKNISLIENNVDGYEKLLVQNNNSAESAAIIGITGTPGAGKSTLTDKLISHIIGQNKTVAVLCIDPSSPFNMGALLGDRIRMNKWYTHPSVFIRSFASRKALGGLSPMMIEITEYLKFQNIDFIIIETVGIGQSEIEIAGLADITMLILVPESGDEIQTMKSGVMEIADIFIINKADRQGADIFEKNLTSMLSINIHKKNIPIIKTIAENGTGVDELYNELLKKLNTNAVSDKKNWLLAEKVYRIIQSKRMKDVSLEDIFNKIKLQSQDQKNINPYLIAQSFLAQ